MKRGIFLSSLAVILFLTAFLLTACGDDDETEYSIKLNKSSMLIASVGASESIEINASGTWEVRDIPDWISISPSSGENMAQIVILVHKSSEVERRKAAITFVCGNATQTLDIEQLSSQEEEHFITLSVNNIKFHAMDTNKTVKIVATHAWKIDSLPSWVHSDITSGNGNEEITLSLDENINAKSRNTLLTFSSGTSSAQLSINQGGLEEIIRPVTLPIFSYNELQMTSNLNYFRLKKINHFVNPSIKDKVYLGNLICPTWETESSIPSFSGYTYNPITVSTSAVISGDVVKTFSPSLFEETIFANYIADKKPQQGSSFKKDDGSIEFYSHRFLYAIGMVNLGIKLDELISGKSYMQVDMQKGYGLIFSFKSILFSLKMNNPENLTKENIKAEDQAKGVSYVSRISYGKVGLLVVESDIYYEKVKAAINKVLLNKSLTSEETNYITSSDINYVYFNNNKEPQVMKGGMDAINAYKKSMTGITTDNIYPVEFSLSDYSTHALSTISFETKVPN